MVAEGASPLATDMVAVAVVRRVGVALGQRLGGVSAGKIRR